MNLRLIRLYPGRKFTFFFVAAAALLWVYAQQNHLPDGLSFRGEPQFVGDVRLLRDLTYIDADGHAHSDQQIFDEVFRMIDSARQLILLDMFLFNDFSGDVTDIPRALSGELTQKLLTHKKLYPQTDVVVVSDPVNTVYGGLDSKHFDALRKAGVLVVETDLDAMRDSNPLYSVFWRIFVRPFGNTKADTVPNPFGPGRVSIRSWLKLINFKANHRKLILADEKDQWRALVTSANPHDGSSAHSNMALSFTGPAVADLLKSELAVLSFSGYQIPRLVINTSPAEPGDATLQVLTEGSIKAAALENINRTIKGDRVALLMFYLSDREIIEALKRAGERGVRVEILLDANKDAFGRSKNGIPNRQSGHELHNAGLNVRWCHTNGEQCHSKTLLVHYQEGDSRLLLGSANFTRRNLDDYNLETDVQFLAPASHSVMQDADMLFRRLWTNAEGQKHSVDFTDWEDDSVWKYGLYRLMEASGFSTF